MTLRLRRGNLDFTDPVAVMQLTKTLLKLDFGLQVELPDDRLCPPVGTGRKLHDALGQRLI
jgi:23S rRNA (adenine1618-N6)-methyltransferase